MHIRSMKVLASEAFAAFRAKPVAAHRPQIRRLGLGLPPRMMKFMAAKLCAARARKAGGNAVAEMVETGGHFHRAGHRPGHRVSRAVVRDELFGKQHQAAAFGVARQARIDRGTNLRAQRFVLRKSLRIHFREAAAKYDAIDSMRHRRSMNRRKLHEFRSATAQVIKIGFIIEMKRLVPCHADAEGPHAI